MRTRFADPIRASSPPGLHQQAGHMTASDLCAVRQMISCQAGPSTHEAPQLHHAARRRSDRVAARGERAGAGSDVSSCASWSRSHKMHRRSSPSSTSCAPGASLKARMSQLFRDVFRSATSRSPTWCRRWSRRTRRDHQRRRCHHARPPEGDLDNSDSGRTQGPRLWRSSGRAALQSGHL